MVTCSRLDILCSHSHVTHLNFAYLGLKCYSVIVSFSLVVGSSSTVKAVYVLDVESCVKRYLLVEVGT